MAKISTREKLGYSMGEYSSSMVWQTLMFFLPIFFTDTYGLSAANLALMFGVVRFFDAFTDPLMGMIADRTQTRWGKFRPYILWLSIPYGIFIVMLFSTPDLDQQGKIIYAYVSYSLMMLMYTAISIPYNSMIGVISPDPVERTSVASYKFIFAYAAGISVQLLIVPMVKKMGGGNDASGYQITMTYFAIIAVVFFVIAFLSSRERVNPDPAQQTNIQKDLKDLISNKPWIILFFVSLSTLIFIAIRSSATAYYFKYFMGRESEMGIFMAVGTIALLLGVLPTKWLANMTGKKKLFKFCMFTIVVSLFMFYFLKPHQVILVYGFQILFSLASGPVMPLLWSMLGDAADYSEYKNKRRATGLVFSALTFSQKTGFALGGIFMMAVLTQFGFDANQVQSTLSMEGIKLSMSVFPAIFALLGTVLLFLLI